MTIGWYVHHHGAGHGNRARSVLRRLDDATVLTSLQDTWPVPSVRLAPDVAEGDRAPGPSPTPRGHLHHAPVDVPSVTRRAHQLVRWFEDADPDLVVVDASVEVTVLARVAGVPPVVVRMHGERTDPAHLTAFDAACSLLAPYPQELEDPTTPAWVRDRTTYVGGFSRYDGRDPVVEYGRLSGARPSVVVLQGTGGDGFRDDDLVEAAAATPSWTWHVLGRSAPDRHPDNLVFEGWIDDVFPYLADADAVVATAGYNTVMEVAAARRPLICIPEDRPFREQEHQARVLADHGLAAVVSKWPAAERWPELLDTARSDDGDRWEAVVDGHGAARAAEHLRALAREWS